MEKKQQIEIKENGSTRVYTSKRKSCLIGQTFLCDIRVHLESIKPIHVEIDFEHKTVTAYGKDVFLNDVLLNEGDILQFSYRDVIKLRGREFVIKQEEDELMDETTTKSVKEEIVDGGVAKTNDFLDGTISRSEAKGSGGGENKEIEGSVEYKNELVSEFVGASSNKALDLVLETYSSGLSRSDQSGEKPDRRENEEGLKRTKLSTMDGESSKTEHSGYAEESKQDFHNSREDLDHKERGLAQFKDVKNFKVDGIPDDKEASYHKKDAGRSEHYLEEERKSYSPKKMKLPGLKHHSMGYNIDPREKNTIDGRPEESDSSIFEQAPENAKADLALETRISANTTFNVVNKQVEPFESVDDIDLGEKENLKGSSLYKSEIKRKLEEEAITREEKTPAQTKNLNLYSNEKPVSHHGEPDGDKRVVNKHEQDEKQVIKDTSDEYKSHINKKETKRKSKKGEIISQTDSDEYKILVDKKKMDEIIAMDNEIKEMDKKISEVTNDIQKVIEPELAADTVVPERKTAPIDLKEAIIEKDILNSEIKEKEAILTKKMKETFLIDQKNDEEVFKNASVSKADFINTKENLIDKNNIEEIPMDSKKTTPIKKRAAALKPEPKHKPRKSSLPVQQAAEKAEKAKAPAVPKPVKKAAAKKVAVKKVSEKAPKKTKAAKEEPPAKRKKVSETSVKSSKAPTKSKK